MPNSLDIISYILSPPATWWLITARIALTIFSLILLGGIIWFLLRTQWLKLFLFQDIVEFFTYRPYGVRKITKTWVKILGRLDAANEAEFKLAVIEAETMLDEILKKMGYSGETLGDKLKNITSATLPNIDQLREAHKVRNDIIHDPDYQLSLIQAKKTLDIYEQTFKDLQAF